MRALHLVLPLINTCRSPARRRVPETTTAPGHQAPATGEAALLPKPRDASPMAMPPIPAQNRLVLHRPHMQAAIPSLNPEAPVRLQRRAHHRPQPGILRRHTARTRRSRGVNFPNAAMPKSAVPAELDDGHPDQPYPRSGRGGAAEGRARSPTTGLIATAQFPPHH